VVVVVTGIGAVYSGEVSVGELPFTVYRMVASEVVQLIETFWSVVNEPPEGLKVGVATLSVSVIDLQVGIENITNTIHSSNKSFLVFMVHLYRFLVYSPQRISSLILPRS
jgi:hypothetical protein